MPSRKNTTKKIAITMGCLAGVGPEIICRLFAEAKHPALAETVVVGDLFILQQTAAALGYTLAIKPWTPEKKLPAHTMPVLQVGTPWQGAIPFGQPSAETGLRAAHYIEQAVEYIKQNHFSCLVTCPISKQSLHEAGYHYPGHTEMLASLTQANKVRMMMAGPKLKVVLVTIHNALKAVPKLLNLANITDCIAMTFSSLKRDFALKNPKIAVAALNPHAGEGGLFGDEEAKIIRPAIEKSKEVCKTKNIFGPFPPDTIFYQAAQGSFDAVIAMYHDQGLIPFKLLHFQDGVNVSLGLPIVRTSVDHGTAYDIAGKWCADASSLSAALSMASQIINNRSQWDSKHT